MQPVFQYSLAGFDINLNGTARIAATHQAPAAPAFSSKMTRNALEPTSFFFAFPALERSAFLLKFQLLLIHGKELHLL